ncbi:hypothetical protein AQUCO_00300265v1 [Aquilegia coerulea]|uniref:Uncharacterized protein n=1 Tax=Aquilegia coerulea TaxID=218851 RepID=A0A2G5EY34_AQUCA|nr:hypothetical protein AQUCO_00300265v1 [Aquilegia coerulea]
MVYWLSDQIPNVTWVTIAPRVDKRCVGVFLRYECKSEFWICLVLTILGYLPGIIYAVYVITK